MTYFSTLAVAKPHGQSLVADAFRQGVLSLATFDIGFRLSKAQTIGVNVLARAMPAHGGSNNTSTQLARAGSDNAMYALSVDQRRKALDLLQVASVAGLLDKEHAGSIDFDLAVGTVLSLAIRDVSVLLQLTQYTRN